MVRDADGEIALKGQDLVRASFNLMDFEHDLPNPWEKPFYAHYYEELQSVEKDYDYIFSTACPVSSTHQNAPYSVATISSFQLIPTL